MKGDPYFDIIALFKKIKTKKVKKRAFLNKTQLFFLKRAIFILVI